MEKTTKAQKCQDLCRLLKRRDGAIMLIALVLLIFAFIAAVAVVTFVFSTSVTSATKEHHMIALEKAEAGLNEGILKMHTLNASLPTHITSFPTGMSHSQAIAYLEGLGTEYYREVNGTRFYLTDTDIIGYGKSGKTARAVKVSYDPLYFPGYDTPAPLYIDSPTITSTFDGNSFVIDGRDHDINGNLVAGGTTKPGVVLTTNTGNTGFRAGLSGAQGNRIRGTGTTPSIQVQTPPPVDIDAFSANLDGIYDYWYEGATTFTGNENYGTQEHPVIIIINGDLYVGGNIEGWGILDVRGSMISMHGTMLWHGIMIAHGASDWLHGTPDVIGSMWIKSDPTDFRISGNPKLLYSSAAIMDFGDPGYGYTFDSWEEL